MRGRAQPRGDAIPTWHVPRDSPFPAATKCAWVPFLSRVSSVVTHPWRSAPPTLQLRDGNLYLRICTCAYILRCVLCSFSNRTSCGQEGLPQCGQNWPVLRRCLRLSQAWCLLLLREHAVLLCFLRRQPRLRVLAIHPQHQRLQLLVGCARSVQHNHQRLPCRKHEGSQPVRRRVVPEFMCTHFWRDEPRCAAEAVRCGVGRL